MKYSEIFSVNYITARERFRKAASSFSHQYTVYPINKTGPDGEELAIDVVVNGSSNPRRVVIVSSGLHGIEGFLGSAIQLALLKEQQAIQLALSSGVKLILIHALNPYGFAWQRRWNEDNIDLNRNFLLPGEDFQGSPDGYSKLDSFLNPTSPPSRFDAYDFQALWLILRHGMLSLKNTLPVGQYDFHKGLFFGGNGVSKTQEILAINLPKWIGDNSDVLHIDFHTGLGKWATYKLLMSLPKTSAAYSRLSQRFGVNKIQCYDPKSISYKVRGGLGTWCQHLLPDCQYDLLTAEFGTYSTIQVLKALRAENRAYWWGREDKDYEWTKHQLREMFFPKSRQWREQSVTQGLNICQQALGD